MTRFEIPDITRTDISDTADRKTRRRRTKAIASVMFFTQTQKYSQIIDRNDTKTTT